NNEISTEPFLSMPDFKHQMHLFSDASGEGVAGTLRQCVNKEWKTIAYYSRTLREYESKYSSFHMELLAIVEAVKHFHPLLIGACFCLHTDNQALVSLMTQKRKTHEGRVIRWLTVLSQYSFKIVHVKGTDNKIADVLSRQPNPQNNEPLSLEQYEDPALDMTIKPLFMDATSDAQGELRQAQTVSEKSTAPNVCQGRIKTSHKDSDPEKQATSDPHLPITTAKRADMSEQTGMQVAAVCCPEALTQAHMSEQCPNAPNAGRKDGQAVQIIDKICVGLNEQVMAIHEEMKHTGTIEFAGQIQTISNELSKQLYEEDLAGNYVQAVTTRRQAKVKDELEKKVNAKQMEYLRSLPVATKHRLAPHIFDELGEEIPEVMDNDTPDSSDSEEDECSRPSEVQQTKTDVVHNETPGEPSGQNEPQGELNAGDSHKVKVHDKDKPEGGIETRHSDEMSETSVETQTLEEMPSDDEHDDLVEMYKDVEPSQQWKEATKDYVT
ncbi:MAG: hypothetical protein GY702_13985, partial [Desulfobulbaceae bacterium]|nr:hypothetical protein [Desulfobulbaceae bacterium]